MKLLIFSLFFGVSAAIAEATPAHVHGQARLEISVDREQLIITLQSPLESLLGFEHAPHNTADRQAVQAMAEKLKEADKVLMPSAAALCLSTSVEINSPILGGKLEPTSHNKLDVRYTWRCAKPEALRDVATGLFIDFLRLRLITVEFAGPQGQRAGRLDARNPRINW